MAAKVTLPPSAAVQVVVWWSDSWGMDSWIWQEERAEAGTGWRLPGWGFSRVGVGLCSASVFLLRAVKKG